MHTVPTKLDMNISCIILALNAILLEARVKQTCLESYSGMDSLAQ